MGFSLYVKCVLSPDRLWRFYFCGVCSEKVEMFLKNISEQFILKCLVVSDIKKV